MCAERGAGQAELRAHRDRLGHVLDVGVVDCADGRFGRGRARWEHDDIGSGQRLVAGVHEREVVALGGRAADGEIDGLVDLERDGAYEGEGELSLASFGNLVRPNAEADVRLIRVGERQRDRRGRPGGYTVRQRAELECGGLVALDQGVVEGVHGQGLAGFARLEGHALVQGEVIGRGAAPWFAARPGW